MNAEDGAVLKVIPMGEERDDQIPSTVAIARGQIFIRTNSKLFCIAKP